MASRKTVVVIHGSYGSPEGNWFPWLAGEVRDLGHTAIVPKFPTPEGQNLDGWREVFQHEIGPVGSDVILVGHSLAPGFILAMLEEADTPACGVYMVSGFLGRLGLDEFDSVNETFVCRDFDWDRIRSNAGSTFVYNSDNDPYVPLAKGTELAEKLGVSLTVVEGAGHINSESGFTEFPLLLEDLRPLIVGACPGA